ncbi:MAG: hypothetical protein C4538_13415 [Nitrospiraceae bacterium]|nr:MAG: hypothetical protein C4538_13415 [Nitrospiraceae bacterium]
MRNQIQQTRPLFQPGNHRLSIDPEIFIISPYHVFLCNMDFVDSSHLSSMILLTQITAFTNKVRVASKVKNMKFRWKDTRAVHFYRFSFFSLLLKRCM